MPKFSKRIVMVITLSSIAVFSSIASASTCTRADFTGTWRIYALLFDSAARCTLIMPSTGTTISSSSVCYVPGVVNSTPLSGTLTIGTDCHITGKITVASQPRQIDAWISKGKDNISGMGWNPSAYYNGGTFSGVKQ